MSYNECKKSITLLAGADLTTTGQFRFGVIGADGRVTVAAAGTAAHGVIDGNPAEGQEVQLAIFGVVEVQAGAAVAAGAAVISNATGQAVAGDGLGTALQAATAAGDVIPVLFQKTA